MKRLSEKRFAETAGFDSNGNVAFEMRSIKVKLGLISSGSKIINDSAVVTSQETKYTDMSRRYETLSIYRHRGGAEIT